MKNRRNYYRVLHVQPDAPLEIIKSCYRALLLKLKKHPDLGGNHWESALLNEAKDVLFDPGKRAKYDQEFLRRGNLQRRQNTPYDSCDKVHLPATTLVNNVFSRATFTHTCQFCNNLEHHLAPLTPDTRCSHCRSPLYPTWRVKKSEIAKRAFQRIAQDFVISYYTEWPSRHGYQGQTCQLSPTGMQFLADQWLQSATIIKIRSRYIEAVARVVYCCQNSVQASSQQHRYIVGVEFLAFISQMAPGTFVSQTS